MRTADSQGYQPQPVYAYVMWQDKKNDIVGTIRGPFLLAQGRPHWKSTLKSRHLSNW